MVHHLHAFRGDGLEILLPVIFTIRVATRRGEIIQRTKLKDVAYVSVTRIIECEG